VRLPDGHFVRIPSAWGSIGTTTIGKTHLTLYKEVKIMFAGEVIMNGAREHGVKNELKCTDIHECTERDTYSAGVAKAAK